MNKARAIVAAVAEVSEGIDKVHTPEGDLS